jgi:ketosteroid isomerase-like protein
MKTLSTLTLAALCCLVLFLPGCSQQQPDTRAADEAALRAADLAWAKAADSKQLDSTLTFYADDAIGMYPNAPMLTSKESIRKALADAFALPGFSEKCELVNAVAPRSGDIGYTYGTYVATMNDAKGKPMTDHGKYLTIWKKQADGKWKVAVDMENTDMPLPPPAK